MAFGGYKFYGYHRGTTTNATLETHVARVAAFIMANAAADSPWAFDPDRLNGYYQITFDGNSYNAIHRLKNDNDTELGYATFFKYSNSGLTGYYVILTIEKIGFMNRGSSPNSGYINFYWDQWCCPKGNNYPYALTVYCVHALSLEPFGDLPLNGAASSDFIPTKSTRISSIGAANVPPSASTTITADSTNSFIKATDAYFGYAIRGCDIITFATKSPTYPAINVLSLNAFNYYINQNDNNGLLAYPPHSRSNYDYETAEPISGYTGYGQFLDENGTDICCNCTYYSGSSHSQYAVIYFDGISAYNRNNVSDKVQITACQIGLFTHQYVVMQSGALGKGMTNPELLSLMITSPSSGTTLHYIGETFNGGNQLICYYDSNAGSSFIRETGDSTSSNFELVLLCGWDSSNPDIRQASSWNEFDVSDWVPST